MAKLRKKNSIVHECEWIPHIANETLHCKICERMLSPDDPEFLDVLMSRIKERWQRRRRMKRP